MAPSPMQLIIVLVIVLLLFGAKKIPELAKGLGTGMHEFRKGASGEIEDDGKGEESKGDEEVTSESKDDVSSEEESSSEVRDPQNPDKTEQRS